MCYDARIHERQTEIGVLHDRENELYDVSVMLCTSKYMWLRFYLFFKFSCLFIL